MGHEAMIRRLRAAAERRRAAERHLRRAILDARAAGLSYRAIAAAVGLSASRIYQIACEAAREH
jgi:transposase